MSARSPLLLAVAIVAAAFAGCLQGGTPGALVDPNDATDGARVYSLPLDLPDSGDASEPHIGIDSEGRIFITGPSGVGSGSPLFISEDGGATFVRVMPNLGRLGGGDTSIAIAPDDTLYLTDLWVGSSTMLVSSDHGKTWWNSPIAGPVPYYDREWNTVDGKGVAYHLGRTFTPGVAAWVSKSTDGGKTWIHAGNPWAHALPGDANQGRQDGPFFTNPGTDAIGVVYSCATRAVCLSTSADQGMTWTPVVAAQGEGSVANIFPAGAADHDGNWYVAYAEREEDSTQIFMASSPDGETWSAPVQVTSGPGVRLFPWMVAGEGGRVALAWYETSATGDNNDEQDMKGAQWHVYTAQSLDAAGPMPTFRVDRVTPEPIKEGTVSTGGLGGEADRSLGDFFSIALDPEGRVHVAYVKSLGGETTLVHAKQVAGEPLYAAGRAPAHGHDAAATGGQVALPAPVLAR
jgi:hypothetical protein